jgi:4-alpha-glucanotransferase
MPKKQEAVVNAWGIYDGYVDSAGRWHESNPESVQKIAQVMEAKGEHGHAAQPPKIVVHQRGQPLHFDADVHLRLEDGREIAGCSDIPSDIPVGYHRAHARADGSITHLFVTPGRCHLPRALKSWGWALQLYALRSHASWGMGDFGDLYRFCSWSRRRCKTGFVLLNPLGAALPLPHQEASPYYPSSRLFLNPLYLHIEDIPTPTSLAEELAAIAQRGRAFNETRLIDRDGIYRAKMTALELLFSAFRGDTGFDDFCRRHGELLERFAIFSTLAQELGGRWRAWPVELQHPNSAAVAAFAAQHRDEINFHRWIQWHLDTQLKRAADELPLMLDLPVGVHPDGFDAWLWQDTLATGVSVGAPPDDYNTLGQDWGLPPFDPHKVRESVYLPLRHTFQTMLQHARGLRIDHVMGLFRLFWIPHGRPAKDGVYVQYPADELLAIIEIESYRSQAIIIGEDLGTVGHGVRAALRCHGLLSYKVMWFESGQPKSFARQSLATISTHDLFTIAGLWSGSDLAAQVQIGVEPNVEGTKHLQSKLAKDLALDLEAPAEKAIIGAYKALATSPSMLLTATLDDALAVEERPNIPGTVDQWPNWKLALPLPFEAICDHPLPRRIARIMHAHGRSTFRRGLKTRRLSQRR